MAVIFFVRHGQALAGAYGDASHSRQGGGLTPMGRLQATITGKALAARARSVDVIVSGDSARHAETAELLLQAMRTSGLVPESDDRWNEYDIASILTAQNARGLTGPALQRVVDAALTDWTAGSESISSLAESYGAFQSRCAAALSELAARLGEGQTAVVVSSQGTISSIVSQLWQAGPDTWMDMSRTMLNCSISKVIVGRRGVSAVSVNEHAHLDDAFAAPDQKLTTYR